MKIAFFISDLHQMFGKQLIKTMEKYAMERKVELHVFASFGLQDNNLLHAEGEKSILYLANTDQYQCIMVAGDTMARYDMHDELMEHLKRNAKCPVLGIRYEEPGYYNLLVKNHSSMYQITRHFLDVHKMKDICFVTGRMQAQDAQERLEGYMVAMKESQIPVKESMIFEGDYWRNKGPQIVEYFMKCRNGNLPEAIICSNDYMALSVGDELIKRGFRIPEDISISGFDDLEESQMYIPSLTSVKVPFDKMAIAALDMAISLANGKEIPKRQWCESELHFRGSCGCNMHPVEFNKDIYHRQMLSMRNIAKQAIYMQSDFNRVSTEEECLDCAMEFLKDAGVDSYYVCLKNQNVSEEEMEKYFKRYDKNIPLERAEASSKKERMITLRLYVDKAQCVKKEDIVFDKQEILPRKYIKNLENKVSIITPIHSLNETYGYIVFQMSDDPDAIPNERFELLCLYLGDTLRRIYMHQNLLSVRDAMYLYLRDPLTDVYNRRGFEQNFVETSNWAKHEGIGIAIASLDMDGLKEINDSFGHKAGDNALCRTANALEHSLQGKEFCARIGGDEFVAILLLNSPDRIERFKEEFERELKLAEAQIKEAYTLQASIGIVEVENFAIISEYLHEADIKMYENKKRKKQIKS